MKSAGFHDEFMKSTKWAKDPWSYFYLLDYIASAEISKCGSRKTKPKNTDVLVNSSGVLYYVSDNFSKKYEICLQDMRYA